MVIILKSVEGEWYLLHHKYGSHCHMAMLARPLGLIGFLEALNGCP